MNGVPDTELFSAYLDGELTADEQVRVEQILATSPEARQLLEELRALDSTLQGLPQEKLDEDLAARVLQVAERRMLLPDDPGDKPFAGRAAEALKGPEADSIGWLGVPWRELSLRGMFSKRALVWSAVVVATALIISYNSPPPPKMNREVANLDKQPAAVVSATIREKRSRIPASDGNWVGPEHPRTPPSDERLAKGESRKLADAKEQERQTDADGVRRKGSDRQDIGNLKKDLAFRDGLGATAMPAPKTAVDEVARGAVASDKSSKADAARKLEKGAAESVALLERKRAAPAMPGASSAKAPGNLEPPLAGGAKFAAEPAPHAVAMSKVQGESKPSAMAKAFGGHNSAGAEGGSSKDAAQDLGFAKQSGKGGETTQRASASDVAGVNAISQSAGPLAAGDRTGGLALSNRFAGQMAPAATFVRFNVSALAVQYKVFENLLADNGLGSEANLKNLVQNARTGGVNLRADQPGQEGRRGSQGPNSQNAQQQLSRPMIYEFDASPAQLATIVKQIGERPGFFSAPKIQAAVSASQAARLLSQETQAKPGGGSGVNLRREEAAQAQAGPAPAPGAAAKQHVVFILNVVDGLAPAAGRASQLPAAPAPAKQ